MFNVVRDVRRLPSNSLGQVCGVDGGRSLFRHRAVASRARRRGFCLVGVIRRHGFYTLLFGRKFVANNA